MQIFKHYIVLPIIAFLLGAASCVDDNLTDCVSDTPATKGSGISLRISASMLAADEATWNTHKDLPGEGYENVIQLAGSQGLRVMIFDKDGKFKYRFAAETSDFTRLEEGGYEIKISEKTILNEDHGEEIMDLIKGTGSDKRGFKIAVMANWPLDQIDAGDRFQWNDDISKLSHFYLDPDIDDQFDIYSHILKGRAGSFMSNCRTSWVEDFTAQHGQTTNRYMDRIKTGYWRYYYDEINSYIKKGVGDNEGGRFETDKKNRSYDFYRKLYGENRNEYKLQDVWRIWDFSGGNREEAYQTKEGVPGNTELISDMKKWSQELVDKVNSSRSGSTVSTFNFNGLYFHAGSFGATFTPYNPATGEEGYMEIKSNVYPTDVAGKPDNKWSVIANDINSGFDPNFVAGFLGFNIPCDVTVRIRASVSPTYANSRAHFYMTWCDQANTSASTRMDLYYVSGDNPETQASEQNVYLTTTPTDYYLTMNPSNQLYYPIFLGSNVPVRIHEIEYVKDVHLYDCDSASKLPGPNNLIPMYGIQDFDAIGEQNYLNTPNGEMFPLSYSCTWADYDYKEVYLLRSIAKVEIYFPKDIFKNHKPTHIYMRTMNSAANCDPIDVRTPTDLLWYGENSPVIKEGQNFTTIRGNYRDSQNRLYIPYDGVDEEIENIMSFCPIHDGSGEKTGAGYKKKLTWFYGSWKDWGWNWNGWTQLETSAITYPRIFNPRIEGYSNNNYVRFVEVDEPSGQYYKYICYSPEKLPDDTDINGDLSSRAKVQHVELHFVSPLDNIDDNYAYRLYFTDYESQGGKAINAINRWDFDDDVEKGIMNGGSAGNLNYIYPVMRNHLYRFYVTGLNSDKQMTVKLKVSSPKERETNITIQ